MRIVLKQDFKIADDESQELQRQFIDLYYKHTKITPEFYIEKTDYSNYQTYVDSDGDVRPTQGYLKGVCGDVYKRYGEFGTDHVIVLVHEDNWKSDPPGPGGIWGISFSNLWHTYQVQYCRFDRDNMANSLGTLYHEVMHSHDSLILTTLGIEIDGILGVGDYDREVVHGNNPKYEYIRHKENTDVLEKLGVLLSQAYGKRKALHDDEVGKMKQLLQLLQQLVVLYRAYWNKKNGVPKNL